MEPWKNAVNSLYLVTLHYLHPTFCAFALCQMLHMNTLQSIADPLAYLQHYLHKVTERQNNSKTNINNVLSTLTAQLQQLI